MATNELSRSKCICLLALVVCCIAILWPKIFLPMLQSSVSNVHNEENTNNDIDYSMMPPKVREALKQTRSENVHRKFGRPFLGDRHLVKDQVSKSGGVMGFFMPVYTLGIVIFFLYTIFKMVFKKNPSEEYNETDNDWPKVSDFHLDPEYRKFILSDEYDENGERIKKYNYNTKQKTNIKSENETKIRKNIFKTKNLVEEFGSEKVSNALHTLIRDMDLFKAKLIEVEECRAKIAQIESAKAAAKECIQKSQNEECGNISDEETDNYEDNNDEEDEEENEEKEDEDCVLDNKENINVEKTNNISKMKNCENNENTIHTEREQCEDNISEILINNSDFCSSNLITNDLKIKTD